jgi:hypothetical protein
VPPPPLVADIKDPGDARLLHAVLAKADVFIQNLAPGAAARAAGTRRMAGDLGQAALGLDQEVVGLHVRIGVARADPEPRARRRGPRRVRLGRAARPLQAARHRGRHRLAGWPVISARPLSAWTRRS